MATVIHHPAFENEYYIHNDGASACITRMYGKFTLCGLYSTPQCRRKGFATDILTTAKKLARKLNVSLHLYVAGFRDFPMNNDELRVFYEKRGFQFETIMHGYVWMVYRHDN